MRWQKPARVAVVVLGLGTAGALYHFTRKPPAPVKAPVPGVMDPAASTQSSGGVQVRQVGDVEQYRLEYGAMRTYPDGRSEIGNAHIIFKEDGTEVWADHVNARGVTGSAAPSSLDMKGHVRLKTGEGATVECESAVYEDATGVTRMPGKVAFTRGRFKGDGNGAVYERQAGVFRLLADAHVVSVPVDPNAPGDRGASPAAAPTPPPGGPVPAAAAPSRADAPIDARADSMTFNRAANALLFDGHARIDHGGDQMTSERSTLYLSENGEVFRVIELRGKAHVVPKGGAGSDTPEMKAQDIDLAFYEGTQTLQRAVLSQQAQMTVVEAGGRKVISGQVISLSTAPDGHTLTHLEANGQVVVQIPPAGDTPARRITSRSMFATGNDSAGLTDATFTDGVTFREETAAARGRVAVTRTGSGKTLVLKLKGKLDTIDEAQFQGNAEFRDGDVFGKADIGTYLVTGGKLRLQPDARARPSMAPYATDGSLVVNASKLVEIDLNSHDVHAQGNVTTSNPPKSGARAGGARGAAASRDSAIFHDDEKAIGFGDEFWFDKKADQVRYLGVPGTLARVKQGETDIYARDIRIENDSKDLQATTEVKATMPIEPEKRAAGAAVSLYQVTADLMTYRETDRTVTYLGTPVELSNADGKTRAPKVVLTLDADGKKLQRMEATSDPALKTREQVTSTLTKGERVWSDSITYDAASNQYVFTGLPFRLQSTNADGSCTQHSGSRGSLTPGGGSKVEGPGSDIAPCPAASKK
jgi:lipopolysaccharide export system protein LptA